MSSKAPCAFGSGLRSSRLMLAGCACAASVACSAPGRDELDASASGAGLIGGSISQPERDAVVFIRANHADGAFDDCSGTLLSPRVVITAKHCVTLVQAGKFVCNGAGTLLENGDGAGLFGAKLEPTRIEIYTGSAPVADAAAHGASTFTTESSDACHDDVAAIVLDTPIQREFYPALRDARPTQIGERMRLVGYGASGHTLIERRELPDVRVIDVGLDQTPPNPNATTPPRTFAVAGGTACFGDSGGPALSMTTGALTGVYSRITGDCLAVESRNTFMLSASFSSVFTPAFQQAGEVPVLEAPTQGTVPTPDGSAGAAGETATPDPSRHEALHCSFGPAPRGNSPRTFAAWLFAALAAGLSLRRFVRAPSAGD